MTDLNPLDALPSTEDALPSTEDALQPVETTDQPRFDPWRKLRENPKSRSQAVKTMCFMCMGWEEGKPRPSGISADIRGCTAPGCPLFAFRPYQSGGDSEEDASE